ncbi:MAG: aspartate--tRNA(Asn) ligase, partial [Candidatus Hydrothermarchaeota archaeon]
MERRYSKEISPEMEGKEVKVAGWVHEIRKLGGLRFIVLRDRKGILQVTLPKKVVSKEVFKLSGELSRESVILVRGKVKAEEKAPNGYEIIPESIEVLSKASSPLPLDPTGKVEANLDTRLDNRFIDLRKPEVRAIFLIRDAILKAGRTYLSK